MSDNPTHTIADDQQAPCVLRIVIALLVSVVAAGLAYVLCSFPAVTPGLAQAVDGQLSQSGVSNPVTAVLLNFRGYDTLLEMVVLLIALLAVWALGGTAHYHDHAPGPILDTLARLLAPVLILVSAYLLWVGAHAPGGAFQAGSVLGAAGVLLILAGWRPHIALIGTPMRLALLLGPAAFVIMALVMLFIEGQLLTYPVTQAGSLILILESAATISIGVTLTALFLGGEPPDTKSK